jgi:stage II sporulation protein D
MANQDPDPASPATAAVARFKIALQLPRHKPALMIVVIATIGVALLASLAVAAPASSKVVFKIKGRGFGHGVGMSQWGAYGFAKEGKGHKKILRHYYSGTKIGNAGSRDVRVLLGTRSNSVGFSGARRACGRELDPRRSYRADLNKSGGRVRLEKGSGKKISKCGRKLEAKAAKRIRIEGEGSYRGNLVALAASGGLNVINRVPLEAYVKGVIPNEVPTSWPGAALRAQATAARSYALATGVDGEGFDQYDDTRSQVYGGVGSETKSTNKAARRTKGEVVKYRGEVIPAFFFSTSGGRTENVEFGFPGGTPRPYLRSVPDPYDDASPVHRWKVRYSRSQMQSRLGAHVEGKLQRIKITKTGVSPRIVKAKVIGTKGNSKLSGPELRTLLDLRSTWAKFKKIRR